MKEIKTGTDIEIPLSILFNYTRDAVRLCYLNIRAALESNGIETARDACRLSMEDLVVITGKPRYELYLFQNHLELHCLSLSMSIEETRERYMAYRQDRFLSDLYKARVEQLKAQNIPNAEEIAQVERKDNTLPIVEDLRQKYIEDIEGFNFNEHTRRIANEQLVAKIKQEISIILELQRAK